MYVSTYNMYMDENYLLVWLSWVYHIEQWSLEFHQTEESKRHDILSYILGTYIVGLNVHAYIHRYTNTDIQIYRHT